MNSEDKAFQELKSYLVEIPSGVITETYQIEDLLSKCWDTFWGSNITNMEGYKLSGRMQAVNWEPPILKFTIERHGGTVHGSSRTEKHRWELDNNNKSATYKPVGYIQVRSRQRPVEAKAIAQEVAEKIIRHQIDERIEWLNENKVKVLIGRIFPESSGVKQTVQGRRKKYRKYLTQILDKEGWKKVRENLYEKVEVS